MPVAATNSETGKKGGRMSVDISGSEGNRQDGEQQSGTPRGVCKHTATPRSHPAIRSGTCLRVGLETQQDSPLYRAGLCLLQR